MVKLFATLSWLVLWGALSYGADKPVLPTLRWTEGAPNCTVRSAEDGHVYYGLSSGDFEVTLSVDSQELQKVPRRTIAMLGVLLTFHYKGAGQFEVQQNRYTLEFSKHSAVVQTSLDPDAMLKHLRQNIHDLTDEMERHQIPKHPDQKEKMESDLQARLKDYREMMDFIKTRALRPGILLDSSKSSATGWVFFSTRNKEIGGWRKPEQFVLRMPVENAIVEIPFELPPKQSKIELRRRNQ